MKIATLTIIRREEEVLLGFKKKGEIGSETVNAPGGKVEPGETLEEGAVREVQEEVGLVVDPEALEKTSVITFFAGGAPDFEVHIFRTEEFAGEPIETEEMRPFWCKIGELPLERMLESDREWLERAVRGEKFNANVYYKGRAEGFERIELKDFV